MYQIARINTSRASASQVRTFAAASISAAKVATPKSKGSSPERKTLEQQLKKETAVLAKLRDQIKKANEAVKAQKLAAAEKKRLEAAFKPYRRLSGLNVFVKEHIKTIGSLAEASKKYSNMNAADKASYMKKADLLNEENMKLYVPKPSLPTPPYAKFLRSMWELGTNFGECSKSVAAEWKKLSSEEKKAYSVSTEEWDAFKKAEAAWKKERLRLFESKA